MNTENEISTKPFKEVLSEIQTFIYKELLKPKGFKKSGRTFNRKNENGIIEVINFQSGQYQFENTIEIPEIKKKLYGSFTINLGIFVPELYKDRFPNDKEKKIYQEYDCSIRTRIGALINEREDLWWNLSEKYKSSVSKGIYEYIEKEGMEWLNQLNTRKKIYSNWIELANKYESSQTAKLDIAKMKILNGESNGKDLFIEYYNEKENSSHKEWLLGEAEKFNIKIKST